MRNVILAKEKGIGSYETERGIPETLAETYFEGTNDISFVKRRYSLFIFSVDDMNVVHKKKQGMFGESYRFVQRTAREIRDEIDRITKRNEISLRFQELLPNIYGAVLKDVRILLEIRDILGDLERRYS